MNLKIARSFLEYASKNKIKALEETAMHLHSKPKSMQAFKPQLKSPAVSDSFGKAKNGIENLSKIDIPAESEAFKPRTVKPVINDSVPQAEDLTKKTTIHCGPQFNVECPEKYFELVREDCLNMNKYKLGKEDRLSEEVIKRMARQITYGMVNYNDWNIIRDEHCAILKLVNETPFEKMNQIACMDTLDQFDNSYIKSALEMYSQQFRGWDFGGTYNAFAEGKDVFAICNLNTAISAQKNEDLADFLIGGLHDILKNIDPKGENTTLRLMVPVCDNTGIVKHWYILAVERTDDSVAFFKDCRNIDKLNSAEGQKFLEKAVIFDPSRGIYGKFGSPEVGYLHISAIRPKDQLIKTLKENIHLPYKIPLIVGGLNIHIPEHLSTKLNKVDSDLYNKYTQLLIKFNSPKEIRLGKNGIELYTLNPFDGMVKKDEGNRLVEEILNAPKEPKVRIQKFLQEQYEYNPDTDYDFYYARNSLNNRSLDK